MKKKSKQIIALEAKLKEEIARKESAIAARYEAESEQRNIERAARAEREKLNEEIGNLRSRIGSMERADIFYHNQVLAYFMALSNPELSKDQKYMQSLLGKITGNAVIQPRDLYRTPPGCPSF